MLYSYLHLQHVPRLLKARAQLERRIVLVNITDLCEEISL